MAISYVFNPLTCKLDAVDGASASSNSFETINCPAGTDPVADSSTDTLNLTSSDSSITITGTAASDTVDFVANSANKTLSNLTNPTAVNQALLGQNGTAAAPSVSFISDTDTGLYRVGANNLGLSAGGSLKLDVDADSVNTSADLLPATTDTYLAGSLTNRFSAVVATKYLAKGATGDVIRSLDASDVILWEWHNSFNTPSGATGKRGIRSFSNGVVLTTANDATANATATGSLYIESGNKTAGTGDSGLINIQAGSSSGGSRGVINLDAKDVKINLASVNNGTISASNYTTPLANTAQFSMVGQLLDTTKVMAIGTLVNNTNDSGTMSLEITTGNTAGDGTTGGVEIGSGSSSSDQGVSFTGIAALSSGHNTGAGSSGEVDLTSGNVQTGTSGSVFINSGNALSTNGTSGPVIIATGEVVSSNTASGAILINTGPVDDGTAVSGDLEIHSGQTDDGNSGAINMGTGQSATATTGDLNLQTGNVSGGVGNSGHIKIQPGSSSGGTSGTIKLNGRTAFNAHGNQTIVADNQVLAYVDVNYITIDSDSAVAADRTFLLPQGSEVGQFLILEWSGTNTGELSTSVSGGGNVRTPTGTALTFTQYDCWIGHWNGTDWITQSFSVNA